MATEVFFEIQSLHADIMFFVVIVTIFIVWQLCVQWQLFDKKRVHHFENRSPLVITHSPGLEMF